MKTVDYTQAFAETFHSKRIIFVEGPAGAGKTTLIENMKNRNKAAYFPIVKSSLKKRTFDQINRPMYQSLVNDTAKLQHALSFMMEHHIVGVDRFFLSQLVYHRIRLQESLRSIVAFPDVDKLIRERLIFSIEELIIRGGDSTLYNSLDYHFVILLPEVDKLEALRSTSIKEYPNDPRQEFFWYEEFARILTEQNPKHNLILQDPNNYFEEFISWELPEARTFIQGALDGEY